MILIVCLIVGTVAMVACEQNYTVTIATTEHGTVTADKTTAKEGETVTLTVTPDENYRLVKGSLKVNGVAIEGNTFTMPGKDASVTAEFEYGKAIPELTIDNAYEILKQNNGTMKMQFGDGVNSVTEVLVTENAILTHAKDGSYDQTSIVFRKNNKWYGSMSPYETSNYLGVDEIHDFNNYHQLALDMILVKNAGKYFTKDGEYYVVKTELQNEYAILLDVAYKIESLKIKITSDNQLEAEFTDESTVYTIKYSDIGTTVVEVPQEAIDAPVEATINIHCISPDFEEGVNDFSYNTFENTEITKEIIESEFNKKHVSKQYRIKGIYADKQLTKKLTMPYKVTLPIDVIQNIEIYLDLELIA